MSNPISPMDVLPMPAGAVELPFDRSWPSERAMALAALKQLLTSRGTGLPLGPETAADGDGRLLSLNRFALQLATGGIAADQIAIDLNHWSEQASAPQLLLSALVDEENAVVAFGGVITGEEFAPLARTAERSGDQLLLEVGDFKGGIDRLFTLVQLLEPDALPRIALATAVAALPSSVVRVLDWLRGQVDPALVALGGSLDPAGQRFQEILGFGAGIASIAYGMEGTPAAAFRSTGALEGIEQPLAVLAIPLGIGPDGQLLSGSASETCIERFRLLLIPLGAARPDALLLRLSPELEGDILPDGLLLEVEQGGLSQSLRSEQSSRLDLRLPASGELIQVTLNAPGSAPLQLPPLQLPR